MLDQLTHSTGVLIAFAVVVIVVVGVTVGMVLFIRRANADARAAASDDSPQQLSLPPSSVPEVLTPPAPLASQAAPASAQAGAAAEPAAAGGGADDAGERDEVRGPLAPLSARPEDSAIRVRPEHSLVETPSPDPARLRLLGLVLGLLADHTRQEQPPQLGTAIARLGDGDQEMARSRLSTLSLTLMGEDQAGQEGEEQLSKFLTDVLDGELSHGLSFSSMPEFQQALNGVSSELRRKLDTIVWSRNADSVSMLTAADVESLERVAVAMATALVIDTTYRTKSRPVTPTEPAVEAEKEPTADIAAEPESEPSSEPESEPRWETSTSTAEPSAEAEKGAASDTAADAEPEPSSEPGLEPRAETSTSTAESSAEAEKEGASDTATDAESEPSSEPESEPRAGTPTSVPEPSAEAEKGATPDTAADAASEPAEAPGTESEPEPSPEAPAPAEAPSAEFEPEPAAEAPGAEPGPETPASTPEPSDEHRHDTESPKPE